MSIDRVDLAKVNDDECKWTIVSGDNEGVHAPTATTKKFYRSNVTDGTSLIRQTKAEKS
jgi:hypothetical protein